MLKQNNKKKKEELQKRNIETLFRNTRSFLASATTEKLKLQTVTTRRSILHSCFRRKKKKATFLLVLAKKI